MSSSPSRKTAERATRSNSTPSDTNNITSDTNFTTSNNNSTFEGNNNNIISIPGTITLDRGQLPDWVKEGLQQANEAHPSNRQRALPISSNNKQRAPTAATLRAPTNKNRAPPRRTPRSRDDDTAATSTNKKRAPPLPSIGGSNNLPPLPSIREQPTRKKKRTTSSSNNTTIAVGSGSNNNSTTGPKNYNYNNSNYRTWDDSYAELVKFRNSTGHCRVPHNYEQDQALANWVKRQRKVFKEGKLTPDQFSKLQGIEFVFSFGRSTRTWEENYAELVKFRNSTGHCRVPRKYEQDQTLANWVECQRGAFKKDKLTHNQISKLQGIGFVFDSGQSTRTWEENYTELVKFKDSTGHCRVPRIYKQDKALGYWVNSQRESNTKGKLTPDQFSKLQGIEFVFDSGRSTRTWEENYAELVKFKDSTGHCRVPRNYEDQTLSSWVCNQRTSNTKGKLTPDRFNKLDEIDFSWASTSESSTQASRVMVAEEEAEQLLAPGDDVDQGDTVDAEQMVKKVPPTKIHFL